MKVSHFVFRNTLDQELIIIIKTQTTNRLAQSLLLRRQSPPIKNKEKRQEIMEGETLK